MSELAILGGKCIMPQDYPIPDNLFRWPIITKEDEEAVLDVVRRNAFSGFDVTEKFEEEVCQWLGVKHAVGFTNGTMSLEAAMYAVGLGAGDEMICPTKTYWASALSAGRLGASVVFANIHPDNLTLDPRDLERCLSPKTKAIMVVHYLAYPADMDAIMAFAKKHNLKVLEDCSHAQGGYYKGKRLGTIGDVAAMSMMSGKSFAAGEMGMLVTNNREMFERALAYGHYDRYNLISDESPIKKYSGMPLGGIKGRVNQVSSALGRVQLKYYEDRTREIRKAQNHFFDCIDAAHLPGLYPIRCNEADGSTMGGWYVPGFIYRPEEIGGLDFRVFADAVSKEIKYRPWPGFNHPLHTHPIFHDFDLMNIGKPERIAFADRDVRELDAALKPSEEVECLAAPWFKSYQPEIIEMFAEGFIKVIRNYGDLIEDKRKSDADTGRWYGMENKK